MTSQIGKAWKKKQLIEYLEKVEKETADTPQHSMLGCANEKVVVIPISIIHWILEILA